ncbi:MAG: dockerin type I domain-containing protein [Clostridia bacterium]|nr:dockerin type I domain-containing protein [Clostridia bacterium]
MRIIKGLIIISIFLFVICGGPVTASADTSLVYTDINKDGSNDKQDAALLLKHLAGITYASNFNLTNADINNDGNVDMLDVISILNDINIVGYGHIEEIGWQNNIKSGNIIGTTGQEKRLEAIRLKLSGGIDGKIEYCAHVQGIGWQGWVSNGNLAGTTGKELPIEAIKIKLKGDIANTYSVEYRTHITGVGWLDWCADGEIAGSVGLKQRMEAIQVRLVKKDTSKKYTGVYNVMLPDFSAAAHVEDYGWLAYVGLGETIGTVGEVKSLQAVQLNINPKNSNLSGGIRYRTHVSDVGWQGWVNGGGNAGTTGQGLPIECIQIELTGNMSKYYDIYYRAHVADIGWMGWTKNGGMAGTTGGAAQMEALQVKIVYKNSEEISEGEAYQKLELKSNFESAINSIRVIQQKYPVGSTFNDSDGVGGIQCKGFAGYVYYRMFGLTLPAYTSSANTLIHNSNITVVGEITSRPTVEQLKNMFEKGRPGDIIQGKKQSSQHTMVFMYTTSTGIHVYDCNSDGKNTVKERDLSYSEIAGTGYYTGYIYGISLYTAPNYTSKFPS